MQGWIGFRTVDQLKEILSGHFTTYFQRYKSKKVLVDATRMTGSFVEANEWMANELMPKLIDMGLQNIATALPQNVFAQLSADDWIKKIKGLDSRMFGSFEEALNWIKKI